MAEDSKIQVIDFLNEVESNRRSLIANAQSKGKIISDSASLSEAVQVNNSINPSDPATPIEVRFFDADGTLLQQSFIEYGGSVTPPPNPNYDPERLTFNRWASAIGERFDNITHDVDYGALYTVNNGGFHIFCTFNDTTGYTVTLSPYQNVAHTITIDWGDGTPNDTKTNTGSTQISHTYAQAGDYEIVVTRDVDIFEYSSDFWYLDGYLLATSANQNINIAVNKAYMKCMDSSNFNNINQNVDVVVTENSYNLSSITFINVRNVVISNTLSSGTISIGYLNKMAILDSSINCNINVSYIYELDKIIIPKNATVSNLVSLYSLYKLIILGDISISSVGGVYSIKSIQILSNSVHILPTVSNAYSLEEYIFPSSIVEIKDAGYLARHSKLTSITIPQNMQITNNVFQAMFVLNTINLPQNFNQSFGIYSYGFSLTSFVDMLNKVQDNTGGSAQTITISEARLQNLMLKTYVVLNNGLWQLATIDTPNAMTLVEAFNSKNWTIA